MTTQELFNSSRVRSKEALLQKIEDLRLSARQRSRRDSFRPASYYARLDEMFLELKEKVEQTATKEEAKAACNLHRDIAKQLNALADLMKKAARYEFVVELHKLFYQSEDGTIQATPIDYDLFT